MRAGKDKYTGDFRFWSFKRLAHVLIHPWYRRVAELRRNDLESDPVEQFARWFESARRCLWIGFPEAMCLSTNTPEGQPDSRMVLMKSFDQAGFVFFTNTLSIKGQSIQAAPRAALNFYWEPLQRQVRIQGRTESVTVAEADDYFRTRPRGSQVGAWASDQSRLLESRALLERRTREVEDQYRGKEIPRPPHWSGYRVVPQRVEFWQGRTNRLHDRFVYTREAGGKWKIERLYP